jgi:hypothetical protein
VAFKRRIQGPKTDAVIEKNENTSLLPGKYPPKKNPKIYRNQFFKNRCCERNLKYGVAIVRFVETGFFASGH